MTDNVKVATISLENGTAQKTNGALRLLESEQEKKERMLSLKIVYFTMFLVSLGFSIVLTGIWPYLDKLDNTAGKEFMGWIVAANPIGQMIFSPIFGYWSNKTLSIRMPLIVSMAVFSISSALYSSLDLIDNNVKWWMFASRLIVGISSANIAVCRSYISAATTLKERTKSVSIMSFAQVLGFVIGPALQAAVTPLGPHGFLFLNTFHINMYTASGWINVLLGLLNFILFLPCFFKDRRVAAKEQMIIHGKQTEKEAWKAVKQDHATSLTLILSFFVIVFNFVLLETLGTSLTMDMYAWTKPEALYYMGILMSVGAGIACLGFCLIAPLSKRYKEINVLIWGGFFLMVIGRLIYIPYRDEYPKLAANREYVTGNGTIAFYEDDDPAILGCPISQEWCKTTPILGFPEFIIGFVLSTISYPIGTTLIQTLFSKILGPRPQGTWQGFMTVSGCLSRIFGPIAVGSIYTRFGTTWTFSVTCLMMVLPMIWLYIFRHKLHIEHVDLKTFELKVVNGTSKQQNSNGFITDRAVIINEHGGEQEQFLNNGS